MSNDIRSKQFLKLFRNPDGVYESMIQRVYRQIREADPEALRRVKGMNRNAVEAILEWAEKNQGK